MRLRGFMFAAAVMVLAVGCVEEEYGATIELGAAPKIVADLSDGLVTRTCIDAATADKGEKNLAVLWTPGDQLGVYTTGGDKNVLYTNEEQSENISNASFATTASISGDITAVYYPYDAANDSKEYTAIVGSVPAEQVMGDKLAADYKWGEYKSTESTGGYKFTFHNIFSLVRFNIDATGTVLEGETLETVKLTVLRGDAEVPVTGDFTFNAVDGSYILGTVSNELTTVWKQTLSGTVSSFATVFPEVEASDKLNFTFETTNYIATLTVTSKAAMEPEMYYTFPLRLAGFSKLSIYEKISGTFKAATYNVDGLPNKILVFTINGDGPGSDGTKNISNKIASDNWDFVGFSEDFAYHTELTSALSAYTFGKYRGNISSKALTSTIDTDGLGFAARNATCSFSNETIVKFTSSSGGLDSGANTCIKKGFRHYVMTLADGTELDVLITHMNTYSDSGTGHINAQHAQLKQIAHYINGLKANKRPIILMGDTNCRYTRHDFQTYFWSVLDSDLVVNDPWVDYQWEGTYPTYNTYSLMVSDKYDSSNKSNDINTYSTQKGEVVDKIIYINNPEAPVQIKANSYLRDYDNYNGLADHMPIVVDFTYTTKIQIK